MSMYVGMYMSAYEFVVAIECFVVVKFNTTILYI